MAQELASADSPTPPKQRGVFAFLFKSVLGCSAFAIGVIAVLILLLPAMIGNWLGGVVARGFSEDHAGRLEIGDLSLSWFKESRVDQFVLRDPDDAEVLRGSAVLPSVKDLFGALDGKIGKVHIDLDANFVAGDDGVTNLQRALADAPNRGGSNTDFKVDDGNGFDLYDYLSKLDLDLQLESSKLAWSDAETRRVGIPFEVRDLNATVRTTPGAPFQIEARAKIAAEQPGTLDVNIVAAKAATTDKGWPLGKVDAKVLVEGFSAAMIDGLANQGGNLKELFGSRFDLSLDARGATAQAGDIALTLKSERTGISIKGRFDQGFLRAADTGIVASLPMPKGYIASYVTPNLPPGAKLVFADDGRPWTVHVPHFDLPFPPPQAKDLAALRPMLEQTLLELDIELPGRIAFESEETRAANVPAAIENTHVNARVAPGALATLRVGSELDSGSKGSLTIDVSAAQLWEKLAQDQLPMIDASVRITGLSTPALGALSGQGNLLADALGPALELTLDARDASFDSGRLTVSAKSARLALDAHASFAERTLRMSGDDKLTVAWNADAAFLERQVAPHLPPGANVSLPAGPITLEVFELTLPIPAPQAGTTLAQLESKLALSWRATLAGVSFSDESLRTAKLALAARDVQLAGSLAAGGKLETTARATLDSGKPGRLSSELSTASAWSFAKSGVDPAPIDARITLEGLAPQAIEALSGQPGRFQPLLGGDVSLIVEAKGVSRKSGTLDVQVRAPTLQSKLAGSFQGGVFTTTGKDQALHLDAQLSAQALERELAAFLPAGSKVTWPGDKGELSLHVDELSLPLPDGKSPGAPVDTAKLLEALSARVTLRVAGVGFENANTRAAEVAIGLRELALLANVRPAQPLQVQVTSKLIAGSEGTLALDASVREPFKRLRDPAAPLAPIDAKLELAGLDGGAIGAFVGSRDLLASLLGDGLGLTLQANEASLERGAVQLGAHSSTLDLKGNVRFEGGALVAAGKEGLELSIRVDPKQFEQATTAALPAGTRVQLAEGAAPLSLRISELNYVFSKPESGVEVSDAPVSAAKTLAQIAVHVEATLPELIYSDAQTTAAQKPVSLRGMRVEARLLPSELPSVNVFAQVVDDPPGDVGLELRALDALAKLSEPAGIDAYRVNAKLTARNVPTAVVDLLAAQDGLLIEMLGPRTELVVSAPDISLTRGAFSIDFHSSEQSFKAEGRVENKTVIVDKPDGVVARVGLGPLVSKRVVGQLVPLLVHVEKPAGAAPALFALDGLSMPFDGDLSKLDAQVRINLGEVTYQLVPGMDQWLAKLGASRQTNLKPFTIPIKKGVASYDNLALEIGGQEVKFQGTFSLVDKSMRLSTNLPLSALGKNVNEKLESVREYLSPDVAVPIEIHGTWPRPSISIGKKFMENVVEDALRNAATKGLEDLFKKKKKKKD